MERFKQEYKKEKQVDVWVEHPDYGSFTDDYVNWLESKLTLTTPVILDCKITASVTYWKWQESGHVMLDDTKYKTTKIVEVDKLTDINEMFTHIIGVKVIK